MTTDRFILSYRDLAQIVQTELELHPRLELNDLYKLIFQASFGPGHLLENPTLVSENIYREVCAMQDDFWPYLQDIGNGIGFFRFSLSWFRALQPDALKLKCDLLAELMIKSAPLAESGCSITELWPSLTPMLIELFPATPQAWEAVNTLAAKGQFPSHSESYRKNYHPHYRLLHLSCSDKIPQLLS